MNSEYFPFTITLRIDWSELDLFAHVNNVMYFKYIQTARVNSWEKTGLNKYFTENKTGPTLASTACQFKKPLFYPGNIRIETEVTFIKTTSFGLKHRIYNDNDELCAEWLFLIIS